MVEQRYIKEDHTQRMRPQFFDSLVGLRDEEGMLRVFVVLLFGYLIAGVQPMTAVDVKRAGMSAEKLAKVGETESRRALEDPSFKGGGKNIPTD